MSSVLFGSISTLADTSELQRHAFNQAFKHHDLEWQWDREEYASLLDSSGGRDRISAYASARGVEVDADAIHATKSALFQESLDSTELAPRAGVVETINEAKDAGLRVGLVTSTSSKNVASLLAALSPSVSAQHFDVVVDAGDVAAAKPDPAAYSYALQALDEEPADCVAIEDNRGGVAAARAAGLNCVAYPNENTARHDFSEATTRVDVLSPSDVLGLLPN